MNDSAAKLSALIIASISSFLTPFMISSVNIALPAVGKEFKTDAVLLSWVATSYLLAAAVSLVPFGLDTRVFWVRALAIEAEGEQVTRKNIAHRRQKRI